MFSLALPASGDQVDKVPGTRKSSWFNRLLQLEGVELTHMRMTSRGDVGWVPTASTAVASCLSYQHYLARSFLSFYPGGPGTVVGGDRRGSRCRRSRGKSYDWTCCYSNTHKCVSVRFESWPSLGVLGMLKKKKKTCAIQVWTWTHSGRWNWRMHHENMISGLRDYLWIWQRLFIFL